MNPKTKMMMLMFSQRTIPFTPYTVGDVVVGVMVTMGMLFPIAMIYLLEHLFGHGHPH